MPEYCPKCEGFHTLREVWNEEELEFPVPGYQCLAYMSLIICSNCQESFFDHRMAPARAFYAENVLRAKHNIRDPWETRQ